MILHIPFPPSVNTHWQRSPHGMDLSKRGRRYRQEVYDALAHCAVKLTGRLALHITLHRGDRRKYDIDNCIKPLVDALMHAGIFEDDEQVDKLTVVRGERQKPGGAVVVATQYPHCNAGHVS